MLKEPLTIALQNGRNRHVHLVDEPSIEEGSDGGWAPPRATSWLSAARVAFTDGDDTPPPTLYIDPSVERRQLDRLAEVKQQRDDDAVRNCLNRLRTEAADPTTNLMPVLIESVKASATLGEVVSVLEEVFGIWTERGAA